MTHGSRQPSQYPYECSVLDRKRARTHEPVTDGVRGVDSRPCNSRVHDTTGCNHQLSARSGPGTTQIVRDGGVPMQIPHTEHALTRYMAEGPPILMHTSVAHPRYKPLIGTESPGRVEVAMTHGFRQPSQYPYECSVLDRKRARTHEQVTDGVRGVDSRP